MGNTKSAAKSTAEKKKFCLNISQETMDKIDLQYKALGFRTKADFFEKAALFYLGYRNSEEDHTFLPSAVVSSVHASNSILEQNVCRYLYKLAVEQDVISHLLAAQTRVSMDNYYKLRTHAKSEVDKNNGKITFGKALAFQRHEDE